MYYINSTPSENGNYGNPQSNRTEGAYELPDALLGDYIDTMGFAMLTVLDGVVTAVERNTEAYDAYLAEHPPQPAPEREPTVDEIIDAILGVTGNE